MALYLAILAILIVAFFVLVLAAISKAAHLFFIVWRDLDDPTS
jgi:hypothetical protein